MVNGAISGTEKLVENVVSDLKRTRKEEKVPNDQPKLNIYDILKKVG